jgi:hypothetical protein
MLHNQATILLPLSRDSAEHPLSSWHSESGTLSLIKTHTKPSLSLQCCFYGSDQLSGVGLYVAIKVLHRLPIFAHKELGEVPADIS